MKKTITKQIEIEIRCCDLCGAEISMPMTFPRDVRVITNGDGCGKIYKDVCDDCIKTKVIPAIESLGLKADTGM